MTQPLGEGAWAGFDVSPHDPWHPIVGTPPPIPGRSTTAVRLLRAAVFVVGVTAVTLWMLFWFIVAFIGVPLGADGLCAGTPGALACGDVFLPAWFALMAVELAVIIAPLILWAKPPTRVWGFVVGTLGASGVVIAFSLAFGLPL